VRGRATDGAGAGHGLGDPHGGEGARFAGPGLPVRVPMGSEMGFEDGLPRRDSLHVSDGVGAHPLAMEKDAAVERTYDARKGRAAPIAAAAAERAR
jgi:nucleoside-diphosphate-sugar epimerase